MSKLLAGDLGHGTDRAIQQTHWWCDCEKDLRSYIRVKLLVPSANAQSATGLAAAEICEIRKLLQIIVFLPPTLGNQPQQPQQQSIVHCWHSSQRGSTNQQRRRRLRGKVKCLSTSSSPTASSSSFSPCTLLKPTLKVSLKPSKSHSRKPDRDYNRNASQVRNCGRAVAQFTAGHDPDQSDKSRSGSCTTLSSIIPTSQPLLM